MAKDSVTPTVVKEEVKVGDYVVFKPSGLQQYDSGHGEAIGVITSQQFTPQPGAPVLCGIAYINRSGLYGTDLRPSGELTKVL